MRQGVPVELEGRWLAGGETVSRRKPKTETLFLAIAGEAEMCLRDTRWEERINRIENCVVVIKERIRRFWEDMHQSELDRLVRRAKESGSDEG